MCEEELDYYCCTINNVLEDLFKSQRVDKATIEVYHVNKENLNSKLQDGIILANIIKFYFPQCEEALKNGSQLKHTIVDVIEKFLEIRLSKEILTDFLLLKTSMSTNTYILWVITRQRYLGGIDFFKHAAALLDFISLKDSLKYHGEKLLMEWVKNVSQGRHQNLYGLDAIAAVFSILFMERNQPNFKGQSQHDIANYILKIAKKNSICENFTVSHVLSNNRKLILLLYAEFFLFYSCNRQKMLQELKNPPVDIVQPVKNVDSKKDIDPKDSQNQQDAFDEYKKLKEDFELFKNDIKQQFEDSLEGYISVEKQKMQKIQEECSSREMDIKEILLVSISDIRKEIETDTILEEHTAKVYKKLKAMNLESSSLDLLHLISELTQILLSRYSLLKGSLKSLEDEKSNKGVAQ